MVAKAKDLDLNDAPARASRLYLIDGNSLAYRAYYALPEEMATSEGFPTNALFGFASMLMRLLSDYKPDGVIVAWDERPTRPRARRRRACSASSSRSCGRSSMRSATRTSRPWAMRPTT